MKTFARGLFFYGLVLLSFPSFGQTRTIYCKDFDFFKLQPLDLIPLSAKMPDNYIECEYINDTLRKIKAFSKEDWQKKQTYNLLDVSYHHGKVFFYQGSGKVQVGYGRLIPKTVFQSDSAFLVNDTLIFKSSQKDAIRIQAYFKITEDSIYMFEKKYPFVTKNGRGQTPLADFLRYKEWFLIDDKQASYIANAKINLKADTIVSWGGALSYHYPLTKKVDLPYRKRPLSLFWLKDEGSLR